MPNINKTSIPNRLPINQNLTPAYAASLLIAFTMLITAVTSILNRNVIYPSEKLLISFVSTDAVNLVLGLPILLITMWLSHKNKLIGLLCWPGALFYVLYTYATYLFGMPFNLLFLPYLLLVTLSAYTIIVIISSIDGEAVQGRLPGKVPVKTAGGILTSIAILFTGYQLIAIISAISNQISVEKVELAQWIADIMIAAPPLIIAGVKMWRRETLGYVTGTGLLFVMSILFIAVIPIMVFQALLTGSPIDIIGILVDLISGMICFIPFILFTRSMVRN